MVKNRKLLAEQLVEESVVLLKNENQLLPLQEGQTVAVFGRSALVTYVSGNGSGAARGAESSNIIIELEKAGISVCEELKQYYLQQREAEAANPQEKFDFSQMKEAVNSGLMYEIFGTYHAPVPEYPIPECLLTNVRDRTNTAILVLGRNAGGEDCDRRLEGDYYLTEEEKKLVSQVCENFPEVIVILNVNGQKTSMILGEKETVLYGKGYIEDQLCGLTFRISSKSFYQINPVQTERLYGKAIELAGLTGKERVVDAYCGIGTIGLIASSRAKEVISVELNRDAVRDAIVNAKRNGIKNVRFYQNDASVFMSQMAEAGESADVVFMDPPRSGSDEKFMSSVIQLNPHKIVYISCDPYTQARDLKYFTKHRYKAVTAVPVDMFPATNHVEVVCCLHRVNS